MSQCDNTTKSCSNDSSHEEKECSSGQAKICCPVEMAAEKWSGSFCQAMQEVQVEILKAKIKKAWGAEMEKVGDAVMESMGAKWQAMLDQAKAHVGLRENIKKVFFSGKN